MPMEIEKGKTKFMYGFIDYNQLDEWFFNNQDIIGVGFVGRSNVGKSSLINAIFGKDTARTSKSPGRTRVVNIFTFTIKEDGKKVETPPLYLFDLPGYGHAQISKEMRQDWDRLMTSFFGNCPKKVKMLNLQDARHPNQKADQYFHDFFQKLDFKSSIVLNKVDKLKTQKEKARLQKDLGELYKEYNWVQDIHQVSAIKKMGVKELENSIINYLLETSKPLEPEDA